MYWRKPQWCKWFHGGGTIKRDAMGRINWQCGKCGRWSDSPVPLDYERQLLDAVLPNRRKPAPPQTEER